MGEGICHVCGERVVGGVQFCTSCGSYLGWHEGGGPAGDPSPAAPGPPSSGPAPAAQPLGGEPPAATSSTRTEPRVAPTAPVAQLADHDRARRDYADLPPSGRPCPRCAAPNEAGRRFCRRCGQFIGEPQRNDFAPTLAPAQRRRWWHRWFGHRSPAERTSRVAYRKSLPWWVRLRRVLVTVVVLALAVVFLRVVGRDPIAWAKHRLNTIRGTVVAVDGVTATADPQSATVPQFDAAQAVDRRLDTAWATRFAGTAKPSTTPCSRNGHQGALLLTLPKQVTVRAINVLAGLSADDNGRQLQLLPTTLDLGFSNGKCQRITVKDSDKLQLVRIKAVTTNLVRVSVAAAAATQTTASPLAAISEIQVMARPS